MRGRGRLIQRFFGLPTVLGNKKEEPFAAYPTTVVSRFSARPGGIGQSPRWPTAELRRRTLFTPPANDEEEGWTDAHVDHGLPLGGGDRPVPRTIPITVFRLSLRSHPPRLALPFPRMPVRESSLTHGHEDASTEPLWARP